jgi:glycosyltransferase involved in cell wall biosynthesis
MGTFTNYMGVAKRAVRHHGGMTMAIRRIWQILTYEGVIGVKARITRLLANRRLTLVSQQPDLSLPMNTVASPERHKELAKADLSPGVLLLGHPYEVLGMGEHVRLSAAACSAADIPFDIRNVQGDYGVHLANMHQDFLFREKISRTGAYRANIFHINADEMFNAQIHLGKDLFMDRYNIGYWAWELSQFPDAWSSAFHLVDEIWAPSRFIEQAIAQNTSLPVIRMPLAVDFPEPQGVRRESFGLPADRFLFLFFFDFTSYVHRKNPQAAIQSFLRAFPDPSDTRAGLVIKMNGMHLRPQEYQTFLHSIECEDPRIILMDNVLTDRDTKGLVSVCDAFLSLHRSEGFGRGLAEAMYLGKPVIATGYSGNLDFTNHQNACLVDYTLVPVKDQEYPFGAGQKWAEPDLDHAVWYMRRLLQEPQYGRTLGQQASDTIKTYHSPQAIGARYRARLSALNLV